MDEEVSLADELRDRARIHEAKGAFSITPNLGRQIADQLDEITRLRIEVEKLRLVRDAAVALLQAFHDDSRGILWAGEVEVVGLRAALDAANDGRGE